MRPITPSDMDLSPYLRIPFAVFDSNLSPSAILLYGLIVHKTLKISMCNNWIDDHQRCYVHYAKELMATDLHVSIRNVYDVLSCLEKYGYIRRVSDGMLRPHRIYAYVPDKPDWSPNPTVQNLPTPDSNINILYNINILSGIGNNCTSDNAEDMLCK